MENMNAQIIITKENGVITIHFEGEVDFIRGREYAGELTNHNVDVVAFSNEFQKPESIRSTKGLLASAEGGNEMTYKAD